MSKAIPLDIMATPLAFTTQLSSFVLRRRRSSNKVLFNTNISKMTITTLNDNNIDLASTAQFSSSTLKHTIIGLIEEVSESLPLTVDQQKTLFGLKLHLDKLEKLAQTSDFHNIPANGYRSTLRAFIAILQVAKGLSKQVDIEDFMSIISYANAVFPYLEACEEVSNSLFKGENQNTNFYDQALGKKQFCFIMDEGKRALKAFFNRNFWGILFQSSIRPINLMLLRLLSSLTSKTWGDSVSCLYSHNDCATHAASYFFYGFKMIDMKNVLDFSTLPPVLWSIFFIRRINFLELLPNTVSISSFEKEVPSLIELYIDPESFVLTRKCRPENSMVKVKYYTLTSEGAKYRKKVVFYLHGGGFVGPKSEVFHDLILKDLALFLPGITIINIDFPSAVDARFPGQLQNILDVYLRVTDADSPLLGFLPTDIIVFGDSSGGHLATDLVILLNDIRKDGLLNPKFPRSLVTMFPKFFTRPQVDIGSMFLSFMDGFLLNPYTQKRILETVGCFRVRDKNGNWSLFPSQKDVPFDWFHDPNYELLDHPYLSPYAYDDFEGIKEISLHILAVNFCSFLQECLTMCKRWKGRVSLRVVDSVPHGFYFLNHINNHCRKATEEGFRMIQDALEN